MQVWDWGPDWAKGVTDQVEYRTDIIVARNQSEQRRALRSKPRRSASWSASVVGTEAARLRDLLMTSHLTPWVVPYWPWSMPVTHTVGVGSRTVTLRGELPTWCIVGTYFAVIEPGFVGWSGKVMRIDDATDGCAVTLDTPAPRTIRPGAVGYPAWVARIQTSLSVTAPVSGVMQFGVEATRQVDPGSKVTEGDGTPDATVHTHDWINDAGETVEVYKELLLRKANWRDGRNIEHAWASVELDAGIGVPTYYALGKAGRMARSFPIMMKTREEMQWWMAFFQRHMGRMRSFYAASGMEDFVLSDAQPSDGTVRLDGQHAISDVNTHMAIRLKDGSLVMRKITAMAADGDDTLVTLETPWAETYPITECQFACYAGLYRLMSDTTQITWRSDQVSEMTITAISVGASDELQ